MGPNTQRRDCVWHVSEPGDTISGNSEMVLIWTGLIEMIIQPFVSLIFSHTGEQHSWILMLCTLFQKSIWQAVDWRMNPGNTYSTNSWGMRGKGVFLRNVPKAFIRKEESYNSKVIRTNWWDFTRGWLISHTRECTKEMKMFKKAVGFDNNFVNSVSVIWGRGLEATFLGDKGEWLMLKSWV